MKVGYKDFWVEYDIIGIGKAILKVLKNVYEKYKRSKDINKEKEYKIALILENKDFIYQTGIVKINPSHIDEYISKKFLIPFIRPFLKDIFKKEYIVEESDEYAQDIFTIDELDKDTIKIYW